MKVSSLAFALVFGLVVAAWLASPAWGEAELEEGLSAPAPEVASPAPEPDPDAAAAEPAAPVEPAGSVARATFTTDVVDREPQDSVTTLENDHPRVFYFSELRGMQGRTVTHRWEHGGEVKAEVTYSVGGPRWRVFSSKNLDPSWLGEWRVTLLDDAGQALRSDSFTYMQIAEDDDPEIPATPAAPDS